MSRRLRLDAELVRRDLARSRQHAADLIAAGRVLVNGQRAQKAATGVSTDQPIIVTENSEPAWVSRGAHKLLSALQIFEPQGLTIADKVCLDAGASTGGFTEVLLTRGAARVFAVDVGYGQLAWSLQTDPRVTVRDRTNIRHLQRTDLDADVELIVSDLSFISLRLVIPTLATLCCEDGDLLVMIKPQFEVGKAALGKNGVVRDPRLHEETIQAVAESAYAHGWGTQAVAPSMLPGPAGNVEYFCWLRTDAPNVTAPTITAAVAAGPAGGQL